MLVENKQHILITGGNGYIAKSIFDALKDKYNITSITRQDFDLTDSFETLKYFSDKYFDIVIHCAVSGGSRLKTETWSDMDGNLKMYYNLLNCKHKFGKLIHFGSGAETNAPESPYGLSKRVIANSILEQDNFYNIKIFGVFDENELDTRFIKGNIKRYINKESILIHQDKFMDFIYLEDISHIINYYLSNNIKLSSDINMSYIKKYKLSDIANIINNLSNHKVDINIECNDISLNYCGNGLKLNSLNLNLKGIELGIKECYNKMI